MSEVVHVSLPPSAGRGYPIVIGEQIWHDLAHYLPPAHGRIVIITDHTVKALYARGLSELLQAAGYSPLILAFRAGERFKSLKTYANLCHHMLDQGCGKDSVIVALGGGVVGDIAGFVAATYMRGIEYVQLPTTLLAMIDSSVGGKTAIDTRQGKNLLGAFWQPRAVIADVACLNSLPLKQRVNGLVEALKMFLTHDAQALERFRRCLPLLIKGESEACRWLIHQAVQIKAEVVHHDEREAKDRMALNFGHTIGHALEHLSNYKLLHGYAVAYGILIEAKIAELLGLLAPQAYTVIASVLTTLNICGGDLNHWGFDVTAMVALSHGDKKARLGQARYVLLKAIGRIHREGDRVAHPVPDAIVVSAYHSVIALNSGKDHGR